MPRPHFGKYCSASFLIMCIHTLALLSVLALLYPCPTALALLSTFALLCHCPTLPLPYSTLAQLSDMLVNIDASMIYGFRRSGIVTTTKSTFYNNYVWPVVCNGLAVEFIESLFVVRSEYINWTNISAYLKPGLSALLISVRATSSSTTDLS